MYIHLSCLLLEDLLMLHEFFPQVKAGCLIRNMYVHEHYIIILKWNVNSFLFVLYFSTLFWHYMCLYSVLSITLHLISFHLVSFHFVLFVFVLFSCWCLPPPGSIKGTITSLHFTRSRLWIRHFTSICLTCQTKH